MRLTLRTLLAYLDDVLDPADAKELGQKIEESEFATNLVHRIRGSIRRLRLGAPKLEPKGAGVDSNVVAEYLDSTLPPDQVPDFEKVCLESEMHLAEVAACHQILTLVLGEPAEVPPETRQRVYQLLASSERAAPKEEVIPPSTSAAQISAPPPADEPPVQKAPRTRPEVPDYLRSRSRFRLFPVAATLLVALVLGFAILRAMGPLDATHPLAGWLGVARPEQPLAREDGIDADRPGELADPRRDQTAPPVTRPLEPGEELEPPVFGPDGPVSPDDGDRGDAVQPPSSPAGEGEDQEPSTPADETPPRLPGEPPGFGDGEALPGNGEALPGDEVARTEPIPPGGADLEPPVGIEMARFISDEEMLLRFNPETSTWVRVAPRAPLMSGDRLLVLPAYRPQLLLPNGVQTTLDGPTELRLVALDADGTPTIAMEYGKMLAITAGRAGVELGLALGAVAGRVRYDEVGSTLAVHVRRYHDPGAEPLVTAPRQEVQLMAVSGRIRWERHDSAATVIDAGRLRKIQDVLPGETLPLEKTPDWVRGKVLTDLDRRAAEALASLVTADRPATLFLRERAEDRRTEVRSLAIRCLAYADYFEDLVKVLNDSQQRGAWSDHIRAARDALARGRESAELLQRAFERERGEDAALLFRLLRGYSARQFAEGGAAELVDALDHEALDVRVLAFENLTEITGMTLLYRPEYPELRRRSPVLKWREKLAANELTYRTAGSPPVEEESELEEPAP